MGAKGFSLLLGLMLLFGPSLVLAAEMIYGKVSDIQTGEAVAGATVTLGAAETHTAADGYFALREEDGRLRVRSPGYARIEVPLADARVIELTPLNPKALYLSFYGVGEPVLRDPALELIENTELNALVIDVKGDRGMLSHKSSVKQAMDIGAQRITTVRNPQALLADLKGRGIYTIARIVVFKDDLLAKARPELTVRDAADRPWRDGENLGWVDPFHETVWDYNIDIAEEAAALGFDEIQFDYIRFPDRKGLQFSRENTQESRVEAITGFLARARERLTPYNVFVSADVFGYVCWNSNDTYIGQQLEELARHLDYISPMLYPSGFTFGVGRYKDPVKHPYEIVSLSLQRAKERTGLPSVRFRPWLQAFRDYAFDRRRFGRHEISAQTRASEEFGANGWMLWNARNVYSSAGLEQIEPVEQIEAKAEIEPVTVIQ